MSAKRPSFPGVLPAKGQARNPACTAARCGTTNNNSSATYANLTPVSLDWGDGFERSGDVLVCSVPGVYELTLDCTAHETAGGLGAICYAINGVAVDWAYLENTAFQPFHFAVMVKLAAGDQVGIGLRDTGGANTMTIVPAYWSLVQISTFQ